jgi:hypothetical protein
MDFFTSLIEILGLSLATAVITGISMGWYLSAVNKFTPPGNVRKSYINDVVIGFSFFLPIAIERSLLAEPNLGPTAWVACGILWLTFSLTADTSNYLISKYVTRKRLGR